jgi:Trypsin-co-occurring domain 1
MNPSKDTEAPILVDFSPGPGLKQTGFSAADLAEKSRQALDKSLGIIQAVTRRVHQLKENMPNSPDELTFQFGIKLDAEAGAMIAKSGVEASIHLTLSWKKQNA